MSSWLSFISDLAIALRFARVKVLRFRCSFTESISNPVVRVLAVVRATEVATFTLEKAHASDCLIRMRTSAYVASGGRRRGSCSARLAVQTWRESARALPLRRQRRD